MKILGYVGRPVVPGWRTLVRITAGGADAVGKLSENALPTVQDGPAGFG